MSTLDCDVCGGVTLIHLRFATFAMFVGATSPKLKFNAHIIIPIPNISVPIYRHQSTVLRQREARVVSLQDISYTDLRYILLRFAPVPSPHTTTSMKIT